MNCRRFQEQMDEYLDAALSSGERAAAEEHLAGCPACRQALDEAQQLGRSLSEKLRSSTAGLRLPPEVRRRVMAALPARPASRDETHSIVFLWRRLAWPLALTAGVVLAGFLAARFALPRGGSLGETARADGVAIQVSYVTPIHVFRREGALVTDALTWQTTYVNQRLWTIQGRRPAANK